MKEETVTALEKSLVTILDKTIAGVEQGVAFLSTEIPDVIRQLLMWHGIKNLIYFFVAMACIVPAVYFAKKSVYVTRVDGFEWFDDCDPTKEGMTAIFWSIIAACMIIPIIIFLNIEWLQIWIAPKVWLIEYASSLVK